MTTKLEEARREYNHGEMYDALGLLIAHLEAREGKGRRYMSGDHVYREHIPGYEPSPEPAPVAEPEFPNPNPATLTELHDCLEKLARLGYEPVSWPGLKLWAGGKHWTIDANRFIDMKTPAHGKLGECAVRVPYEVVEGLKARCVYPVEPVVEPGDEELDEIFGRNRDAAESDNEATRDFAGFRALYQAGLRAASERKPASREGLYRHLERLLADAPIDAFLSMTGAEIKIEFTSEQKPSPPESDEVGAREAYYRRTSMRRDMAYHSVSRPLPRWSELDSGDRASELAAYRFARDIGRAERDAALRELSDARQADGETIGRLRGELAEAKLELEVERKSSSELADGLAERTAQANAELAEAKAKLATALPMAKALRQWAAFGDGEGCANSTSAAQLGLELMLALSPEHRPAPEKGE